MAALQDEFVSFYEDAGDPDSDIADMEHEGLRTLGPEPPEGWSILGAAGGDMEKAMQLADRIARALLRSQEWLASFSAAIDDRIARLQERKQRWAQRVEENTESLRRVLAEFYRAAPRPERARSLPLPSGLALRSRKVPERTSVVKDAALAYCLQDPELEARYVEYEPRLNTKEFAKRFKLVAGNVVDTDTGQVIEPVTHVVDGREVVSPLVVVTSPEREVLDVIPPKEGKESAEDGSDRAEE